MAPSEPRDTNVQRVLFALMVAVFGVQWLTGGEQQPQEVAILPAEAAVDYEEPPYLESVDEGYEPELIPALEAELVGNLWDAEALDFKYLDTDGRYGFQIVTGLYP